MITRVKWLVFTQPQSRILGQDWVLKSVNSVLSPAFGNRFHGSFQICVCRCAVLQSWFKMKTTSIFPVNGLASLILMSKMRSHGSSLRGFSDNIFYKAGLR